MNHTITKQIAKEFVTERYCYMCRTMTSDGLHDGTGDINFWGLYLDMLFSQLRSAELEVEDKQHVGSLFLRIGYSWIIKERFELCKSCAKEVAEFIKKRHHEGGTE